MARTTTGVINGRLHPCPDKPNCICSFAEPSDGLHYYPPRKVTGNPIEKIKASLEKLNLTLVAADTNYLHCVATTAVFRFKDDLEFLYDPKDQLLHLRSASRLGHSDLGANRKRMDRILERLGF